MRDKLYTVLAYLVCSGAIIVYYVDFIIRRRCFLKEPGRPYAENVGVESWQTFSEKMDCYIHWTLLTPTFTVILAAMIYVVYWLVREKSTYMKVILGFIIYGVFAFAYLDYMTVDDTFDKILRSKG